MKNLSQLKEVGTLPTVTKKIKLGMKSQKSLGQSETIWADKRERVRSKCKKRK